MSGADEAVVETFGPVFCPSCNKNTFPYQDRAAAPGGVEGGEGHTGGMMRMVDKCSACNSVLGVHGVDRTKVNAIAATKVEPMVPMAPVPSAQPWTVPTAPGPSDFLGQCRARLDAIDLELARMAGLQAEAKQLRKVLGKGSTR